MCTQLLPRLPLGCSRGCSRSLTFFGQFFLLLPYPRHHYFLCLSAHSPLTGVRFLHPLLLLLYFLLHVRSRYSGNSCCVSGRTCRATPYCPQSPFIDTPTPFLIRVCHALPYTAQVWQTSLKHPIFVVGVRHRLPIRALWASSCFILPSRAKMLCHACLSLQVSVLCRKSKPLG